MARNVEIKCKVANRFAIEQRVALLADSGPEILFQVDQFFESPNGRLKLRTINQQQSELIFYRRPNLPGPKISQYQRVPIELAEEMSLLLSAALEPVATVAKRRTLYLVGQTRVHLDRVEQLGDFLELEVVLTPDQDIAIGNEIATSLCEALGLSASDLVDVSYVDLLREDQ